MQIWVYLVYLRECLAKKQSMDIDQRTGRSSVSSTVWYNGELTFLREGLDITSLNGVEGSAALDILEAVLDKKTLPVRLMVTERQNQLLWHLYSEQRSYDKLKGYRPLAMGYPLITFTGEETSRCLPVFLWSLRLEPSLYRANEWEIHPSTADPCRLNPLLKTWLEQRGLADLSAEIPPFPDRKQVIERVSQFITGLELESDSQNLAITPVPEPAAVIDNRLLWSGLIGVYPRTATATAEAPPPRAEALEETGYPYGLLPQDPLQASALAATRQQSLSWVEGISGTGKTHLLTQIATMALANGQKCLIVSPAAGNLKEIQDRLASLGIQRLLYLIRNPESETAMLLDFFRAMAEGAYLPPELDTARYQLLLDRCERERNKLDQRYTAVKRNVFGQHDWTETVGLFLESNRQIGKELLGMQLYTQDFEFSFPEFQVLETAISESRPLYQKINTLKHPLRNLHPDIFLQMEKEEGRALLTDRLEVFLGKTTRLQRRYFSKVNQYGEALRKHYDKHYRELSATINVLREKMAEGKNQFGQLFEESSERKLRFYGLFSAKHKKILAARMQIESLYDELKRKFELFGYFDFQWPPAGSKPAEELRPIVLLFEEALGQWQRKHAHIIQDNIQRLSRKTVHPRLHMEEEIEELEDNLNFVLEALNEARLYEQPFEHKMLTIPKRQKYLESVIEQMEETRRHLPGFLHFYDWQRNWLQLEGPAQKLIRALVKVKPSDWKAAFKSWYLHHCLNLAHTPRLPQTDDGLDTFVKNFRQLQPLLLPSIARQWDLRRTEAIRHLKTNLKKDYQLLFNRENEALPDPALLSEKWTRGLETISEVLPVLLAGEAVIPYLASIDKKIYDYILIDEAHGLDQAQFLSLQHLGHHLVVCSDPSLEGRSGRPAWPEQWRREGLPSTQLTNVYHWRPGNLLQLTGHHWMHASESQLYNIFFEQVEGRYDEQSQMNSAEAEMIITLLNRIEKTPQRTYPVVGIVCMTRGQRNLIQQLLFQIKKQDAAGAETIRQLERNGLGVYAIDEIGGVHFDIMLFSGVWGPVNARGELTSHLAELQSAESQANIFLLMSRPSQSVYIVNSIPRAELEQMSGEEESPGNLWYAGYLLYVEALARKDQHMEKRILQRIYRHAPRERSAQASVFGEQVRQELSLYLREQELQTNVEQGHFHFPLVARSHQSENKTVVLQPDAFIANSPATDYVWESEQRTEIARLGHAFLPAWSVKWWQETSLEARRVSALVLQLLEEEEENAVRTDLEDEEKEG